MSQRTFTVEEYLTRYEPEPTSGCWLWTGNTLGGYGVVSFKRIRKLAHRVSFEYYKGKIPEGLIIRHTCDNPMCINPDHLIVGTNSENSKDMVKRGRSLKGNKNHQFGKTGELATCFGRTGEKHPMYGKNHTEEAKRKIAITLTGKIRGPYKRSVNND